MTDRYQEIRQALAMGPTPGPWRPSKSYGAIVSDSPSGYDDAESVHAYGGHIVCESVQEHNRHLIAACDPDTIRELLEERDALREVLQMLVNWTPSADVYRRLGFNPEVPMRAHDAAKALLAKGNKA